MKELKYNLRYLLKKRELYISIFILFLIALFQAYLTVNDNVNQLVTQEHVRTAEYQFILYNAQIYLNILVVVAFPIALNLIVSDVSWFDRKNKTSSLLHNRLDYKKNILARYFFSVILAIVVSFTIFIFNYVLLRFIYGSGNNITWFQCPAFQIEVHEEMFLDEIRIIHPVLFTMLISFTVSIMLGLLTGFSYTISFFIKQRVVIYFTPLVLLIGTELLFPLIGLRKLSFIKMLQPFDHLTIYDYLSCAIMIILASALLLIVILNRKDILE